MNVLIFGGRGYLAQKFTAIYPDAVLSGTDIADPRAVAEALDSVRPDVVINAAGKTGVPNVDWCEDHKTETLRANVTGPLILLDECAKRGIYWVHLSSGCVYEGHRPSPRLRPTGRGKEGKESNEGVGWKEEDEPNFTGSFYARTKVMADRALKEFPAAGPDGGGVLILRLRMPFDGVAHPKNLLTKLTKFPRVLDVQNSITCLTDFLMAAETLIARRRTGIYHVVNDGAISPYRIAELYREIVEPSHAFERLLLSSLPQVVRAGRSNCILSTAKLKGEGIEMRPIEEAVREALQEMKIAASGKRESEVVSNICVQ